MTKVSLTEEDRARLDALRRKVLAYREGRFRLMQLSQDVETLLRSLEDVPSSWFQAAWDEWAKIEEVYADMLDRGLRQPDELSQPVLDSALESLEELVERLDPPK